MGSRRRNRIASGKAGEAKRQEKIKGAAEKKQRKRRKDVKKCGSRNRKMEKEVRSGFDGMRFGWVWWGLQMIPGMCGEKRRWIRAGADGDEGE